MFDRLLALALDKRPQASFVGGGDSNVPANAFEHGVTGAKARIELVRAGFEGFVRGLNATA